MSTEQVFFSGIVVGACGILTGSALMFFGLWWISSVKPKGEKPDVD